MYKQSKKDRLGNCLLANMPCRGEHSIFYVMAAILFLLTKK